MDFSEQYRCTECAEVYPFKVSVCPSCGGKCMRIAGFRFGNQGIGNIDVGNCADRKDLIRVVSSSLRRLNLHVRTPGKDADCGLDLLCETTSCRVGIKVLFYSDADFVGTADVKDALAGKAILGCEAVVIVSTRYFSKEAFDWSNRTGVILRHPDDVIDYFRDKLGQPKDEHITEDVRQKGSVVKRTLSAKIGTSRYAQINNQLCVCCGRCIQTCKRNAIVNEGTCYRIKRVECTGCGACVKACSSGAIMMWASACLDRCSDQTYRIIKAPFDGYVEMCGDGQCVRVETDDPLFDITGADMVKTVVAPCDGIVIPRVKTGRKYNKDTVICLVVDEDEVCEWRSDEIARNDPKIVRAGCSGWIKDIKVSDGTYVHSGRDIVDIDFYGLMKVSATAQQKGHVTLRCSQGQFVKFGQKIAEVKN